MRDRTTPATGVDRRRFLLRSGGGLTVSISALALSRYAAADAPVELPRTVGQVSLPDTALAIEAVRMCRAVSQPFLVNHCMRTFLFAALSARRDGIEFDHEMIFIAAALHDLGLTEAYSSKGQPFEMDSADAAKAFLSRRGVTDARAEMVWNAIALHASPLSAHQPAEVGLVGTGAGVDVFGGRLKTLPAVEVDAVLGAFPRLGFKAGFEGLLVDYCRRKPMAQIGTWTDAFCRSHAPGVHFPDLGESLRAAPFSD